MDGGLQRDSLVLCPSQVEPISGGMLVPWQPGLCGSPSCMVFGPRSGNWDSQVRGLWCSWEAHFRSVLVFSWQFTCTDLWKTCVHHSSHLHLPPANSPVLVHQIDLLPLSPEMGMFYVDEIIIADTDLTGDYQIYSPL